MIIPSIDIQSGQAVQLVQGKTLEVSGGDPFIWADKFSLASEIAVIDLDAAMSKESNVDLILNICSKYRCRVGGGIRDLSLATKILDSGATKIIIGTNATREFLSKLPKNRLIAAVDSKYGEVVVKGWGENTHKKVEDVILELKDHVSEFLVTFVETEGSLQGIDIERAIKIKKICGSAKLTVAGGVKNINEITKLDLEGINVQVGMALYKENIEYADAVTNSVFVKTDSKLVPTVIVDRQGVALGLAWSSEESIRESFKRKIGIYFSRSRNVIWEKGSTSGNFQKLLRVDVDCDRDCLRFTVEQIGDGFCHLSTYSCWQDSMGIGGLERIINSKENLDDSSSYTKRLLNDTELLKSKLFEELNELIVAEESLHRSQEAADLLYFYFVYLKSKKIDFVDVIDILKKRELSITRRAGDKKKF